MYAETYQNSLKRGVQSLGGTLSTQPMEGQATEIRPEPKPVKWGTVKNTRAEEEDEREEYIKFIYSGLL